MQVFKSQIQLSTEESIDRKLIEEIKKYGSLKGDYWAFEEVDVRNHAHAYFHYPAMMVPEMQRNLLEAVLKVRKDVRYISDPFVGSGTILTESMRNGLSFYGQDINPLAILICHVKKGPFFYNSLQKKKIELISRIHNDSANTIEVNFPGLHKWFKKEIIETLSKIRRAIVKEKSLWARKFFWMCFAEAVRLSSNSRTSTFKLHIRDSHDLQTREYDVLKKFESLLDDNIRNMQNEKVILQSKKLLSKSIFKGKIRLYLKDSSKRIKVPNKKKFDLIICSPPYGDNHTTVTYGQFSYLPLQWIHLSDIDKKISSEYLKTTCEIDSRSLGGRKISISSKKIKRLLSSSQKLKTTLNRLKHSKDKYNKILYFSFDLKNSLINICSSLKKDGYIILTVGNRRVADMVIPMDRIVVEILSKIGCVEILTFTRDLPTKRMAYLNKTTQTMRKESVIVLRKTSEVN